MCGGRTCVWGAGRDASWWWKWIEFSGEDEGNGINSGGLCMVLKWSIKSGGMPSVAEARQAAATPP